MQRAQPIRSVPNPRWRPSGQLMKTVYPKSTTWPYVLFTSVLFYLVVEQPHDWALLRTAVTHPAIAQFFRNSAAHPELTSCLRGIRKPSLSGTDDEIGRLTATAGPLGTQLTPPQTALTTETRDVAGRRVDPRNESAIASPSEVPRPQVWYPPPGWIPHPIRRIENAPVRVSVAPPVAHRVEAIRADDGFHHRETRKAAPQTSSEESLSPSVTNGASPMTDRASSPAEPSSSQSGQVGGIHRKTAYGTGKWPEPIALYALLDEVPNESVLSSWASSIRHRLEVLSRQSLELEVGEEVLPRLAQLASVPSKYASLSLAERQLSNRIRHALVRRTDTWQVASQVEKHQVQAIENLQNALTVGCEELIQRLSDESHAPEWITFLQLRELLSALRQADAASIEQAGQVTLARTSHPQLDKQQTSFLNSDVFVAFKQQLLRLRANQISAASLLRDLETLEVKSTQETVSAIVQTVQVWRASPDAVIYRPLCQSITTHYRNANIRVSISERLINHLVPAIHRYAERISDTILGAEVRGRNSTSTSVGVHLIPDPRSIRLSFLADGRVHSQTASHVGVVTMFNRGNSTFSSDKQLVLTPDSIELARAHTQVQTGNELVGLETALDNIPIVGWLAREIAKQRHRDNRIVLRDEIRRRVRRSASNKMDREVSQRLSSVEQRVQHKILRPLQNLDLDPQALEMRSTEDRAIVRARIAGPKQLAAHTPRPRARADSLFSFQLHQSAMSNLVERLQLGTESMSLVDLTDRIKQHLNIDLELDLDDHKDVRVRFADVQPIAFEFNQGHVAVELRFAELRKGPRSWNDVSVRGAYRTDIRQMYVELIRDDGIELLGQNLRLKDQLILRSVFTKVLARNHRLGVLRESIAAQPQLKGLSVSQVEIRDGWIGISVGQRPETTVARTTAAENPSRQPEDSTIRR